jgi:hypothetical protein
MLFVCACTFLHVCLVLEGLTMMVETHNLFFVTSSVLILLSQKNITFNYSADVSTYPLVSE